MLGRVRIVELDSESGGPIRAALQAEERYVCLPRVSNVDGETSHSDRDADLVVAVARRDSDKVAGFLEELRSRRTEAPVLIVLPEKSPERVLRTAAEIADEFLVSPWRADELCQRVARLIGGRGDDIEGVRQRLMEDAGLAMLAGNSPSFRQIVEQLPALARSAAGVLITGETGTGKELCARAIHHLSGRRNLPFIAVDCAALPDHLFENEVFGHARGAFTDAFRDQRGLVALAEGGTLFLDEIDSLSLGAQAKLLRFLQERTYRPLGSERFERANVTVLAASNDDLEARVRERAFRPDLFFRLNVLRLHLPPLRQRRDDIPVLAAHFLREYGGGGHAIAKALSSAALRKLAMYHWPGNVRELSNIVQRAAILASGTCVLPCHVTLPDSAVSSPTTPASFRQARAQAIEAFECAYVEELLRAHRGNITRAARDAKKDRRAFGRLVKKYEIDPRVA